MSSSWRIRVCINSTLWGVLSCILFHCFCLNSLFWKVIIRSCPLFTAWIHCQIHCMGAFFIMNLFWLHWNPLAMIMQYFPWLWFQQTFLGLLAKSACSRRCMNHKKFWLEKWGRPWQENTRAGKSREDKVCFFSLAPAVLIAMQTASYS